MIGYMIKKNFTMKNILVKDQNQDTRSFFKQNKTRFKIIYLLKVYFSVWGMDLPSIPEVIPQSSQQTNQLPEVEPPNRRRRLNEGKDFFFLV